MFLALCQSQTGGTGSGSPVARDLTAEGRAGRRAVPRALRPGDERWSGVAALGQPALSLWGAPLSTTASPGAVFAPATSPPGTERRLRAVESGDVSFPVF